MPVLQWQDVNSGSNIENRELGTEGQARVVAWDLGSEGGGVGFDCIKLAIVLAIAVE